MRWLAGHADEYASPLSNTRARDQAVRDYKRHLLTERKLAPASVALALAAVDSFYSGYLALGAAEVARVRLPRRTAPRALTEAEQRKVLRAGQARGPRDLAIVLLGIYAGPRLSEATALDVDDVPITARTGQLIIRSGKGDHPRTVPLHPEARRGITDWLVHRRQRPARSSALFLSRLGDRMAANSIDHSVRQVGKTAGIPALGMHVLRHTFATNMVRAGVDLVVVAELLGHASVETVRIYTLPSVPDVETAVNTVTIDY